MILVTGGAGFIGSHVCLALMQAGHGVVVLDDYSNSQPDVLARVERLAHGALLAVRGDVRDETQLSDVFARHELEAVVHLAGLKSVAESVTRPAEYEAVNVGGTRALVNACRAAGVRKFVFSSSATVYGDGHASPIAEDAACLPVNPYGTSKLKAEDVLRAARGEMSIAVLRYFNAAGAHESGQLGEAPAGEPVNLFAVLAAATAHAQPELRVFGTGHPTRDGSCERDYVHVQDLAAAHLAALGWLSTREPVCEAFNLGTGRGHTVLEVHRAFELAAGRRIAVRPAPPRAGDLPSYFADVRKAQGVLGWTAGRGLDAMAQDACRWQAGRTGAMR